MYHIQIAHRTLLPTLVLLLLALSTPTWGQTLRETDVQNAAPLVEAKQLFVLDVREPSEYATGRIAGAVLIPLGQLQKRLDELAAQKDAPLLAVCASGGRSAEAVRILTKNGFSQAMTLKGGMNAWRKANLPMEKP
jgi:rhodanese-related sulfurtransferase